MAERWSSRLGYLLATVGAAAATNATRLGRTRATLAITAGVFVLGLPSALSHSPLDLAVAGRPVLDLVDESVGTYALPVSALLVAVVFTRVTDLDAVDDLGALVALVRWLVPAVLVVVTAAKALGVARPAWRLLVSAVRDGLLGAAVTAVALLVLGAAGWTLRDRLRYRRPRRR